MKESINDANTDLQNTSNGILDNFRTSANAVVRNLNESTTRSLDSLNTRVESMSEQVQQLTALEHSFEGAINTVTQLKDQITNLAHDIDESQKAQDRALEDIKNDISTYNANVSTNIGTITNLLSQVTNTVNATKSDTVNIKNEQASFRTTFNQECTDIKRYKDEIRGNVVATSNDVKTNANNNKTDIIADAANNKNVIQSQATSNHTALLKTLKALEDIGNKKVKDSRIINIVIGVILLIVILILHFIH